MSIHRFPGDFRLGVLNEPRDHVLEPGLSPVEPKLMLLVLLSGLQRFRLAGRLFELDAQRLPDALFLRIGCPCEVEFLHNWGQPLIKLQLATPLDWLENVQGGNAGALAGLSGDFAALRFLPGAQMVETARTIVATPQPLARMALGMSLLDQCLAGLSGEAPSSLAVVRQIGGSDIIARLRRLIAAAPEGAPLTAPALARACGMGLRSLERLVRDDLGTSLGALIREERLEAGLRALRAGQPVARAAARAGYSSAANFAVAVRRRFGDTPSHLRHDPDRVAGRAGFSLADPRSRPTSSVR